MYLDAFAGEGRGVDRLTGEEFSGSARIALEATAEGGFTRFRFFEQASKASELEAKLRTEFPNCDIRVYPGDCNITIPQALTDLKPIRWAPTFAFIDPEGMEFAWETLAALADHKRGYRADASGKPEYKVELWLLFPTSGIVRTLALEEHRVTAHDERRANRLFGTQDWKAIYARRVRGQIEPAEARERYVNLMRWRLERVLGYGTTHPLALKNTRGGTLYHMIFATDNEAGTRIMSALYTNAAKQEPQMRRDARDRAKGWAALDLGPDLEPALAFSTSTNLPQSRNATSHRVASNCCDDASGGRRRSLSRVPRRSAQSRLASLASLVPMAATA